MTLTVGISRFRYAPFRDLRQAFATVAIPDGPGRFDRELTLPGRELRRIMIVKTTIDQRGPITQEELKMLERAKNLPIVFDEDSPELTETELKRFHRVS